MAIGPGKIITKGDDIFGCDLVAVKKAEKTLFAQLSLDAAVKKRLDQISCFGWNFDHQTVQLWIKTKPNSITIKELIDGQFVEVSKIIQRKRYDLRKTGYPKEFEIDHDESEWV